MIDSLICISVVLLAVGSIMQISREQQIIKRIDECEKICKELKEIINEGK